LTFHNPELSNKPFPEKKAGNPGKKDGYNDSKVFCEAQLKDCADWTPEAVERRRKELEQWAADHWRVDPPKPSAGTREAIRLVLNELNMYPVRRQLFSALHDAGNSGLTNSELSHTINRSRMQLAGMLGALGHKIAQTKDLPPDVPQDIGLFLNWERAGDELRYFLRSEFREMLDSGELDSFDLLVRYPGEDAADTSAGT